jgi:signal transduction histidine kinase
MKIESPILHRPLKHFTDFVVKFRGLWLRAALCWTIGLVLLYYGSNDKYDLRFQLRGLQEPSKDIVLLLISQDEWIRLHQTKRNWIRPLKEITELSDGFYWNPQTWSSLLKTLLAENPQAVAVSFYFGNNIRRPLSRHLYAPEFRDPRIVWAARQDNDDQLLAPVFAASFSRNVGLIEMTLDDDGFLRRFESPYLQTPNMGLKIAQRMQPDSLNEVPLKNTHFSRTINYQGPPGSFSTVTLTKLLSGDYKKNLFKGKTVIIGAANANGHQYQTALGSMTRAEVLANIATNAIQKQWIQRMDSTLLIVALYALLILGIWVMSTYPQSLGLVFFFWTSITLIALSLWVFDSLYIWVPVLAPTGQLAAIYIVFLSFQLTLKDNLNWRLEQERKYLLEVEELKRNFVSLISHDLKTPIAKIQAICDRLLANQDPINKELSQDLINLRKESSELHRYIQSILQITRVESRDFKINKDAADVNEIIENVVQQLTPLAKEKDIEISLKLEPMFLIEIDGVLIQEVILNLIENAIKYTPDGGAIKILSLEVDDRVYVEVEDNGIGISEKDQEKVFEKFYRSEEGELKAKGSGLGLYLSKYFIELHGGEVFLKSWSDKGTRIGFWLPVKEESGSEETLGDLVWNKKLKPS